LCVLTNATAATIPLKPGARDKRLARLKERSGQEGADRAAELAEAQDKQYEQGMHSSARHCILRSRAHLIIRRSKK